MGSRYYVDVKILFLYGGEEKNHYGIAELQEHGLLNPWENNSTLEDPRAQA